MAAKPLPTWQDKVLAAIQRDQKRAGLLGVLLVVLAVLGGRAVLGAKSPANADASTPNKAAARTDNAKDLRPPVRKDSHIAMRKWLATPIAKLDRNLFAARIDNYPQLSGRKIKNGAGSGKELNPDEKLALQTADELKERQSLTEALQLEARQLKLMSTMTGASPQALINGRMVREGDVVASGSEESPDGDCSTGFRVLKIEARRVIIEREGIKLEILMK
jgi:hypothetical protein